MICETEKQRMIDELKRSEEKLLDMLWLKENKIKTSLSESKSLQYSPIEINFFKQKKNKSSIKNSKINYSNLVRSDMLDISELSLKNTYNTSNNIINSNYSSTGHNDILNIQNIKSYRPITSVNTTKNDHKNDKIVDVISLSSNISIGSLSSSSSNSISSKSILSHKNISNIRSPTPGLKHDNRNDNKFKLHNLRFKNKSEYNLQNWDDSSVTNANNHNLNNSNFDSCIGKYILIYHIYIIID